VLVMAAFEAGSGSDVPVLPEGVPAAGVQADHGAG
jgi:hypothetical protein